jgi:hypothetical protein
MVQIVGAQMTSQESKAELTQEANTTTGEMADKTAQIWLNLFSWSNATCAMPLCEALSSRRGRLALTNAAYR